MTFLRFLVAAGVSAALFSASAAKAGDVRAAAAQDQNTAQDQAAPDQTAAPAAPQAQPQGAPAPVFTLPSVEIIGTTPVQGVGIEKDRVPANVQSVPAEKLQASPRATVSDLLNSSVGSVSINEVSVNPFQPDINFRGFTASPTLGTPQGIAIYQNGVRVNEPFGDTVQWDVVPEFAIDSMQVIPGANPVFGLNALGGAIALQMKNGFNFQGTQAEVSGGSWNRKDGTVEFGAQEGNFGFYAGGSGFDEDGWRPFSSSTLGQFYGDARWRGDDGEAGISFGYATTHLEGIQPTPVEALEQDRTSFFTAPDFTKNELVALTGDGNWYATDTVSVQGNVHLRRLISHGLNSNTADFVACGGILCEADGVTPITDLNGNNIPASIGGNATDVTSTTDTTFAGGSLQTTIGDDLLGMKNQFIVGTSIDFANVWFHNETNIGSLVDQVVVPSGIFISGPENNTQLASHNRYYGAYFSDTLSVTDDLSVTAAGRYNIATVALEDRSGISPDLTGDHEFIRFNPALGATYKLADNVTTYANYSEANRAPTAVELSCADPDNPCHVPNAFLADPPLSQVVNRSVEAGLRGRLKAFDVQMPVNWSAAIFGSRNYDDIIFVATSTGGGSGFFQNAGITQRVGAEVNLNGAVGDFNWYVDYSYIRATFESNLTLASPSNPFADLNGDIHVTPGDRMPGIPLHTAKLGVGYNITEKWNVGVESVINSGVFLRGDEANQLAQTDAYAVFNLRSSYQITDYLEGFVKVDNIFDTNYETFGTLGDPTDVVPGFTDPRFLSPGAPIGAWAGLRVKL
jgi:outer membrane receptor protein involved in Fe transport